MLTEGSCMDNIVQCRLRALLIDVQKAYDSMYVAGWFVVKIIVEHETCTGGVCNSTLIFLKKLKLIFDKQAVEV